LLKSYLHGIEFGQQRRGRFDGPGLPVADQHDVGVVDTVHELDRGSGDTAQRDIEIDLRGEVRGQFVHAEANGFFGGHEGLFPGRDDHRGAVRPAQPPTLTGS
jgi:hypothetical protein